MATEKFAHRLALLEGVELSAGDLESITADIADMERIVAELEDFGQSTPWISLQAQPADKKV